MFLIKEKRKNGINLCIVQSYRDPVTKVSKTKRIMNVGYLADLQKIYDDPVTHFQQVAKEMSEESSTETKPVYITLDPAKSLELDDNLVKNYGYTALSAIYHELKLDVFFRGRQRSLDIDYSLNSIVKLLVYGRILFPGSEKRTFDKKGQFFDKMVFALDDVYRSFTYLYRYRTQLQTWTHERICENYGRDTSQMYYYITNHYFEVGEQDRLLKGSGSSAAKENRSDPIIQMGLFVDKKGLPVSYEVYPRNTVNAPTLSPALKKVRQSSDVDKIIVVSDNAINSTEGLYSVISGGNGYIVSQNVRSADKEMKEYALNQQGYAAFGEECKIKSRIYTRKIRVAAANGSKKTITFNERQIVFHNAVFERWARAEREDVLQKARDLIAPPDKYGSGAVNGATKHIKNREYDNRPGNAQSGNRRLHLDEERLKEEMYDGYYIFLTSELDESVDDIINTFGGLWNIEDSFRLINNTFLARPTFVSRSEHIHAHFLTCFVSLLLTRILEMKIQKKYPLDRVLRSLKKCTCVHIEDNYYVQSYHDPVLDLIEKSIGVDFSKRYRTLCNIRENIGATKKR